MKASKTSFLIVGAVCLLAYGMKDRVQFFIPATASASETASDDAFKKAQDDIQKHFNNLNKQLTTPVPKSVKVVADDSPTPTELQSATVDAAMLEQAWRDWMQRHDITQSALVVGKANEILHSANAQRNADTPYPLASLAKAVTAMCLNQVLEDTPFTWQTTLAELQVELRAMNITLDPAIHDLRLEELATHVSGFPKNIVSDNRTTTGRNLYTQQHFARTALGSPVKMNPRGRHHYSNVNYAIMGQIITALTGQAYATECKARIMDPAGAAGAVVGGYMWATGGFGGWSISAQDYARFVMHWYGPERPWIIAPQDYPYDPRSGAGLGVFHTKKSRITHIRHAGAWNSKKPQRQHGAVFQMDATGAIIVAHWQGQLPGGAVRDLRLSLTPHLR